MTNDQQTAGYTFIPTLAFTFKMSAGKAAIKVYESEELVGFVTHDGRDNWVLPSVAKAARRWAGWKNERTERT